VVSGFLNSSFFSCLGLNGYSLNNVRINLHFHRPTKVLKKSKKSVGTY
jgi:hypothetical protein